MNCFLGKGDTLISCHVSELHVMNVVLYTDFIQLLFIHSYLPKRLSYTVIFRLWWTWPLSLHQCTPISFSGNHNRVFRFFFFFYLWLFLSWSLNVLTIKHCTLWMSWQSSTATSLYDLRMTLHSNQYIFGEWEIGVSSIEACTTHFVDIT